MKALSTASVCDGDVVNDLNTSQVAWMVKRNLNTSQVVAIPYVEGINNFTNTIVHVEAPLR